MLFKQLMTLKFKFQSVHFPFFPMLSIIVVERVNKLHPDLLISITGLRLHNTH